MDKLKIIDANEHFNPDLESQWIAQAQQGDQQAFHHLYENYHRRIYALCWRMMADKDSAEDVCQEVFVQLWQKITNFRGESKFSTWLHSVASNIVLGHIRKNKTNKRNNEETFVRVRGTFAIAQASGRVIALAPRAS